MKQILSLVLVLLLVEFSHQFNCSCDPDNTIRCDNSTGVCQCKTGWTGQDCDQDVNECTLSDPCLNVTNGTCVNTKGGYHCGCHNGILNSVTGECLDSLPFRCDEIADIIFILDSSGSIGADNFRRQLSFVANFTGLMLMSSTDVRFGLIQFSDLPQKEFDLNRYSDIADLQNAILNITYMGHTTATDMALQMVLDEQMFSVANGGRDEAPDIIIALTDGASNSMTQTAVVADRVKASNVTIIAVGITSGVNVTELENISSKKEYVLTASDYTTLQELSLPLLNTTCTAIVELKENITRGSLPFKCDETADVVFILDSSGSIGTDNFKRQLSFAADFTGLMRMSSSDVRFGLIQFSTSPQKEFDLNQYSDVNTLQEAILSLTYLNANTRTDLALKMITDERMFSVANGGRGDAPDIIIILTDEASNEPDLTVAAARKLKASGITMFAVGISSGVNATELETLSSKKDYVLLAKSFTTLRTLMTPLLNKTCTAIIELKQNMDGSSDICLGGQYVRGVAHLPYPGDCSKIIQCYYNQLTGKTLAVIRRCPLGHFWNQQTLECAQSWTVQCPFDKCQNECQANSPWDSSLVDDDGTMTYPMSGKRRGYYKCVDGKSYPRCCPKDSVYVPGIGCYLNRGLREECGPEKSCKEGINVCKKIPVWDNRKSYLETFQVLGHYPASCIFSDYNIVACRCDIMTLADHRYNRTSCLPYFQTQPATDCSEEVYDLPVWQPSDKSPITLKLTLSLPSPHFQVVSTPQTCCQDCYSLKIWGDSDTVNFAMGNKRDGVVSQSTLPWKNAKGDLDIVVMLHSGRLTFGVAQGLREVATSVEAFWTSESFQCAYRIKTQSEFKNKCILNQLQVFDCLHKFDNIYSNS